MNPVSRGTSNCEPIRPDTGSAHSGATPRRYTEKNMMSSSPHQNIGIE